MAICEVVNCVPNFMLLLSIHMSALQYAGVVPLRSQVALLPLNRSLYLSILTWVTNIYSPSTIFLFPNICQGKLSLAILPAQGRHSKMDDDIIVFPESASPWRYNPIFFLPLPFNRLLIKTYSHLSGSSVPHTRN